VDALIAKGSVDKERVGRWAGARAGTYRVYQRVECRFKAVSVGAGIFRLDDVLREYGHHAVHAAVSAPARRGRSGNLQEDFRRFPILRKRKHHADPARRKLPRCDTERVRTAAGAGRPGRAVKMCGVQGIRARVLQSEAATRGDGRNEKGFADIWAKRARAAGGTGATEKKEKSRVQ